MPSVTRKKRETSTKKTDTKKKSASQTKAASKSKSIITRKTALKKVVAPKKKAPASKTPKQTKSVTKKQVKNDKPTKGKGTKVQQKADEKLKQKLAKSAKTPLKATPKATPKVTTKATPAKAQPKKKATKKATSPEPIKKVKKGKSPSPQVVEQPKMVKQLNKGGAIIDQYCPIKTTAHVYMESGKAYSTMLNQSNLNRNNNKFYVIQLLQDDSNSSLFYTFNRWGRVGVPGQNALKGPSDIFSAKSEYQKKINDKTKKGEYTEIELVQGDEEDDKKPKKTDKPKKNIPSKLDPRLQNLISLIFDMKMMNNQMKEIGYDAKKCPLGKLADSTIMKGYDVLNELFDAIQASEGIKTYNDLSGRFFSLIPHDFGFKHMSNFVIDTEKKVREKYDMLQSLSDMKIATKILESGGDEDVSQLENNYQKLKCNLQPIDKTDKEYKMIEQYVSDTKGHFTALKILDIFRVENKASNQKYDSKMPNKFLLWHGSRVGNFVGILSSGFRIMPNAGGLFGKGLYFADMLEKSAGYCSQENGVSLALLGEVAMGTINEKMTFDCQAHNLPKGKTSVLGCASQAPPMTNIWGNQVKYAAGKPVKFKGQIGHNEYLVYTEKQATMRFLIKFAKGTLW